MHGRPDTKAKTGYKCKYTLRLKHSRPLSITAAASEIFTKRKPECTLSAVCTVCKALHALCCRVPA